SAGGNLPIQKLCIIRINAGCSFGRSEDRGDFWLKCQRAVSVVYVEIICFRLAARTPRHDRCVQMTGIVIVGRCGTYSAKGVENNIIGRYGCESTVTIIEVQQILFTGRKSVRKKNIVPAIVIYIDEVGAS